jgi:Cu2+-exporting ATPase
MVSPGANESAKAPASRVAATGVCAHCGQPAERGETYCCAGCEAVAAMLRQAGLERYYELRGGKGLPVPDTDGRRRDRKWLEALSARIASAEGPVRVELDVQGVHCAACVWLHEQLFQREQSGLQCLLNPALGRLSLTVRPGFDLGGFVRKLESFGYLVGEARKDERSLASTVLWRLGVSIAASMNAMIFSIAIYAGLADGQLKRIFHAIDLGLATLVVLVGGSVFFRAAWAGLRRGVLHLDLPIALGLAASYAGSVHAWSVGGEPYFDTVCVFTTLMLVGRFLQERLLEKNRRMLLDDAGAEGLLTRRVGERGPETVPCASVAAGDVLLVGPGDLVPVDLRLDTAGSFSLDWISGESRPRTFTAGEVVPAGAFSCAGEAITGVAETAFAESMLLDLLRTPTRGGERAGATPFWQGWARRYVAGVLVLSAVAFAAWFVATRSFDRAAMVATAVLVVTCPCAFGIATPLAYDLAQAALRRVGLFVRSVDFLDRAAAVRKVVFDKTGTITHGAPRVVNPEALDALDAEALSALATLTGATGHPKSVALHELVSRRGIAAVRGARVVETAGHGVEAVLGGHVFRLGRGPFAGAREDTGGDAVFSRDGVVLAAFSMEEQVRKDAAREIERLRSAGYEVFLLSGDATERVVRTAARCGVDAAHAFGDMTPRGKAEWLAARDRSDTLMIGDGVNDLAAVERAHCSGTPAIDRPFVASRSDFYFVTPGLAPIGKALDVSRVLARVVRRNLFVALAYNAVAVALAFAGLMSPLVCAVLMPVSSLSTIAVTSLSMKGAEGGRRMSAWKS